MTSGATGGGGSSTDPADEDAAGTPPDRCGAADSETPNDTLSSATAVHLEHTPRNCIGNVDSFGSEGFLDGPNRRQQILPAFAAWVMNDRQARRRRRYSGYGSVRPSSITSMSTVGSST